MATSEITATRSTRMTGENRRNQIVQVAIDLFARKGFNGTTTKEIAEAAGVSEAIIFRHFAGKGDLYSAIIDHKMQSTVAAFNAKIEDAMRRKDDRMLFENLALDILDFHKNDQTHLRLMLYSALEGHDLARLFHKAYVSKMYDRFAVYFRERIDDGVFRTVEPKPALRAFIGMVINQSIAHNLIGDAILNLSNKKAAETFADIFLNGIKKNGKK